MNHLINLILLLLFTNILYSQNEKLIVEGAVIISDNDDPNPVAGTIRWTGLDFEGFDGTNWISLTCCDADDAPEDCDGNSYTPIQIGSQMWLKENMKATCFNDGTPITWATSSTQWQSLSTVGGTNPVGAHAGYASGNPEGALYNWHVSSTATNGGFNVCPIGWHVPTDQEFQDLISFLDATASGTNLNSNSAGGEMKTTGTINTGTGLWEMPNTGATNSSGFCLNPNYGVSGLQSSLSSNLWTQDANASSPVVGGIGARGRSARNTEANLRSSNNDASDANPIRCVKD